MIEVQDAILSVMNNPKMWLFIHKANKIINKVKDKIDAIKDPETYIKNLLLSVWIIVWWNNPWDIKINNPDFYNRIIFGGSLALWESYMDWWWDCDELDVFFEKILDWWLEWSNMWFKDFFLRFKSSLINMQTRLKSNQVIDKHYNIWNEVYEMFLDQLMLYTCAYYKTWRETLEEAQKNKLDLIAKKLWLKPWMKVLDIWCWWWNVARYMADNYDVEVVWITLSEEQYNYAQKNYKDSKISIKIMDYRDLDDEQFDAIYTIWMTEHVWPKNYLEFVQKVDTSLKTWWKFLWHTIWSNKSKTHNDPWFHKYIFPNWVAPSQKQMSSSIETTNLLLEDSHNFWQDYTLTIREWYNRFKKWYEKLREKNPEKYDDKFYRMFEYYFSSCIWAFRWRHVQLYQNVYSKGCKEKYNWIR